MIYLDSLLQFAADCLIWPVFFRFRQPVRTRLLES